MSPLSQVDSRKPTACADTSGQYGLDHQAAFIHGHIPAVGNRDLLSDGAGQHGIDHQPIVLGFPELECECTEYAEVASGDEHSHVTSTSCREGGPVHLFFSFKDLVPGFEYKFEIKWTLESDALTREFFWESKVTAETDYYRLRELLLQPNAEFQFFQYDGVGERVKGIMAWDAYYFGIMAWKAYKKNCRNLLIEVMVSDMYPGLTREESLIGIRRVQVSDRHSKNRIFRLKCADQKSAEDLEL
jgi:hypothetical protein